jgi:FlaA1/EpsC-like NDP-sugar epimerase
MPERKYRIVGLLDDAAGKQRVRIHNVPVIGTVDELPALAAKHQISEVLIAMPNAGKEQMQRIVSLCRRAQVQDAANPSGTVLKFRTVPSMSDVILGRVGGNALSQIRDVSVNDLLGRDAVEMELGAVGSMIQGQVVLVSGAGGSIGSEMCRTICRFEPRLLVLVDKAENAIFEIERELKRTFPTVRLVPAIGDISDSIRVEQLFHEYGPSLVFHAAAHKHVPLAESNCGEAIRNNVFGTRTLADAAARSGVKQFVMISTDKAVNPTSIMGATKRCAEIYIQSLARRSHTNFITVRFGNVLGSNGSVVPIFKQQIAAGGPVTVTHPEMRRYFMTIPEASQLVLQAAALGQRGEIFILDMGKPVRILDLARDLIMLSGLRPEVDIPIVFTGLRPGEKLYEELSIHGEDMVPTRHAKIAVWKGGQAGAVQKMIDDLEPLQHCMEREAVLGALVRHIPEMRPWVEEESVKAGVRVTG